MPSCEMCGKGGNFVQALIEGVEMSVCQGCATFGKVKPSLPFSQKRAAVASTPEYTVVAGVAAILRQAREKRKMTQEEFAHLLQERASVAAKWEQGVLKPSVEQAKKTERILGLSLVTLEEPEAAVPLGGSAKGELTLGDFVKVRKRGGA